jgi:hypothetical protein
MVERGGKAKQVGQWCLGVEKEVFRSRNSASTVIVLP